jgi:hypothetical protein
VELADKLGNFSGYTDYSLFYVVLGLRPMKTLNMASFIPINPELSLFTMLFMGVLLQL